MDTLVWTSEQPKVEGWYWIKARNFKAQIAYFRCCHDGFVSDALLEPRFAGPLPEPEEPPP